jgi:hypothetical protein
MEFVEHQCWPEWVWKKQHVSSMLLCFEYWKSYRLTLKRFILQLNGLYFNQSLSDFLWHKVLVVVKRLEVTFSAYNECSIPTLSVRNRGGWVLVFLVSFRFFFCKVGSVFVLFINRDFSLGFGCLKANLPVFFSHFTFLHEWFWFFKYPWPILSSSW